MLNQDIYEILDLVPYFNNDGISSDKDRTDGDFTGAGNTYPEEDLPPSNSIFTCDGVMFQFPDKRDGANNNISLEGQHIPVPESLYDKLFLLGASDDNSLEDTLRFSFADGTLEEALLGLSSWRLCHNLKYGERVAIKCRGFHFPSQHVDTDNIPVDYGIWMQKVPVPTHQPLIATELPDNPGMHIFALTLRRVHSGKLKSARRVFV